MIPIILTTVLTIASCGGGSCKYPRENQPDNIAVIGDSLACGSKWRIGEVSKTNETVTWDCKVGSSIEYWNGGKAREALEARKGATSVIIFLGTNNYSSSNVPDTSNVLKEVQDRGLRCTWVGPTAVNGKKPAINEKLRKAVEGTCTYVDATDIPLGDGIHPTWDGWLRLLKIIWAVR